MQSIHEREIYFMDTISIKCFKSVMTGIKYQNIASKNVSKMIHIENKNHFID